LDGRSCSGAVRTRHRSSRRLENGILLPLLEPLRLWHPFATFARMAAERLHALSRSNDISFLTPHEDDGIVVTANRSLVNISVRQRNPHEIGMKERRRLWEGRGGRAGQS